MKIKLYIKISFNNYFFCHNNNIEGQPFFSRFVIIIYIFWLDISISIIMMTIINCF